MTLAAHPAAPRAPIQHANGLRWAGIVLTVALSGVIDALTGFEISVFLLYTVPVGLATRYFGARAGVWVSFMATLVWIVADRWSGHAYTQDWILYFNACNRFACFALTVAAIRHVDLRHQRLQDRLQALTSDVHACTQCSRIGAEDGYWRTAERYLVEKGGAQVHHKVCPDCARRSYARAGYRNPQDEAA